MVFEADRRMPRICRTHAAKACAPNKSTPHSEECEVLIFMDLLVADSAAAK
jgi:hypothetical protein